jgi:hypothetical protein
MKVRRRQLKTERQNSTDGYEISARATDKSAGEKRPHRLEKAPMNAKTDFSLKSKQDYNYGDHRHPSLI